jgi:hypothetical protein
MIVNKEKFTFMELMYIKMRNQHLKMKKVFLLIFKNQNRRFHQLSKLSKGNQY